MRGDVAAVGERVDPRPVTEHGPLADLEERPQVGNVRMDPAGRDEPEEMDRAAALLRAAEGAEQGLVLEERAVLDGPADPHEVLEEDPPRSDRQVADLGVAHLALGQADRRPGRAKLRRRVPGDQAVEHRCARELDGVARAGWRDPPAVEDHERDERIAGGAHVAARQIAANDAGSSEAPPTSAPSTAGCASISAAFSGFTEPP